MKIKSFIIFIVIVIVVVGGLGFILSKSGKPGKYDDFAKSLKDKGAEFFGAFWCTHCQSQKEEFGSSKKYLPYIECSKADNSPVQVCLDNKIESYPTWRFKDGIKITSKTEPKFCPVRKDGEVLEDACRNISSEYYKTWVFDGYRFTIKSGEEPIREGDVWQFNKDSVTTGELPLEFLADQIGYTLPQ